jgi:hypothetical protein
MQPDRMSKELVKYDFTKTELLELGGELAEAAEAVYTLEKAKAASAAHYSAELKRANQIVGELASKRRCGYELREMECRVIFDQPRTGFKTVIRPDNGQIVRDEPMTRDEMQRTLQFPEADTTKQ